MGYAIAASRADHGGAKCDHCGAAIDILAAADARVMLPRLDAHGDLVQTPYNPAAVWYCSLVCSAAGEAKLLKASQEASEAQEGLPAGVG